MRQRRGAPVEEESSSSDDDDDAFARLSKKGGKDKKMSSTTAIGSTTADGNNNNKQTQTQLQEQVQLPASTTSSMKRHHVASSDSRKAKMDSLLQELTVETARRPISKQPHPQRGEPDKKGSFVSPEEEHLTTNIFVGNLAPSLTEEEIAEFFGQFGDLYSVKVMWPRTPEERARNRNTGFVCFMNRDDAEEAMKWDERDPFNVGRRIMMRWGKNVKKFIKKGTGGVAVPSPRSSNSSRTNNNNHRATSYSKHENQSAAARHSSSPAKDGNKNNNNEERSIGLLDPSTAFNSDIPKFDPDKHGQHAVRVVIPPPARAQFISTVASFVAKDGAILEDKLLEMEASNPDFIFLTMPPPMPKIMAAANSNQQQLQQQPPTPDQQRQWAEHIYYRWRVFSFTQGDSFRQWNTEPFVMTSNSSVFWIPPPLNLEAARQEGLEQRMREEDRDLQKKQRRRGRVRTGRQLETGGGGGGGGRDSSSSSAKLTREEMNEFVVLTRKRLCASRESICEAMAFCFEKSKAADQIARLLQDLLLEDEKTATAGTGLSVETRMARLYLLSDILFNSQQPGVRNAFLYRDRIERMAPDVFTSLGKHEGLGRMSKGKLSACVSSVLGAWTNWGVYNPVFLDELQARFEGRELPKVDNNQDEDKDKEEEEALEESPKVEAAKVISVEQRQEWAQVSNHQEEEEEEPMEATASPQKEEPSTTSVPSGKEPSAEISADKDDVDGESLGSNEVGEEDGIGSDLDGEPLTLEDFEGMDVDDEVMAEIRLTIA